MDQVSPDPFSPGSFTDVSDDGAHLRQDGRDSLFLAADFRLVGSVAATQVRVRNLSSGGLMAEMPNGLEVETRVEFDVRGIGWVPGKVAWSTAGRVGVAFDRPIDPMLARKPVGNGGKTPAFTKPILPRR